MKQVRARLAASRPIRASYNIGVPVGDYADESLLMRRYHEIGHRAWRISDGIEQGMPLERAIAWLRSATDLQSKGRSKVHYCFEGGAALLSFVTRPDVEDGLYGLVDIGAWTTDIAFFHLGTPNRSDPMPAVHLYATASHRVAVNAVDQRAHAALVELWDLEPHQAAHFGLTAVREARERGRFGDVVRLGSRDQVYSVAALDFARACVGSRLKSRVLATLKEASRKQPDAHDWGGLSVFVVGGGIEEPTLWAELHDGRTVIHSVSPLTGYAPDGMKGSQLALRFCVAAGLAFPEPMWAQVFRPSEVTSFEPMPRRYLPTVDDLGIGED
jgi:hypothetical protein